MNDSEKLVVCIGKGASMDAAAALAKHIGAPLCDTPGEALTLRMDGDGLSLCGYGMTFRGDFTQMLHRITHGRLPHEMLARLSKTHVPHPTAVDATAGMGEDSLLLAGSGEGIYTAELDLDRLRAYRRAEAHGNAHRHPGKYGLLTREGVEPPFIREDSRP